MSNTPLRLAASAAPASSSGPAPAAAVSDRARGQVAFDASVALALREQARSWRERVPLVVDSELMFGVAGEELQAIKALQHQVEAQRLAITGPLNDALRAVNALFRAPRQFLEEAEGLLKAALLAYSAAERQRLQCERSAAQQRQVAEYSRLVNEQREHEAQAHTAEAAAQEALVSAERAASQGDQAAAARARASAAEHRQRAAALWTQAHASAQQAQEAQVVTYAGELAAPARLEGLSERTMFGAQVTDLEQLVAAVAAGQAPLECLQANDKFLAAQARAVRRAGPLYPGVLVSIQRTMAASPAARSIS